MRLCHASRRMTYARRFKGLWTIIASSRQKPWRGAALILRLRPCWRPMARYIPKPLNSEAPRGKLRGIFAEPCEAKDAIPPCGKPQGFLAKKGEPLNP